ncbi:MAG: lipopolysaccharide export system protein [Gallionellaceae bacterium]|nr:MAG: lipopolysaccharide export system protein [Gallionellaceae bacterium]
MNLSRNNIALLLALLLTGYTCATHAEKADRSKPIYIESDRMNIDDTVHISTFEGSVKLTQGTLRLTAAKIVVTEDAAGNKFCVATGHLASFRQKREETNEYVEGYGERIEYNSQSDTVDFYVRARVKRGLDDVRGDHITYSTQTEIFNVSGRPLSGRPESGRVRATIHPKEKDAQTTPLKNNAPKDNPIPSDRAIE